MNTFRNVHFKTPPELAQTNRLLPREREVTNDPAREYAARPGQVEALPDAVVALILGKQGFSKVGRNGIAIDLDGRTLKYWSEHSVTCATRVGEKVLWTVNRQQPEVLHILTSDAEYVESIPLDGTAAWFQPEGLKVLGAKKRANERKMQRIAELHEPDAQAALERELQHEAELKGLTQTFPATDRSVPQPGAERINPNSRKIGRRENLSRAGAGSRDVSTNGAARRGGINSVDNCDSPARDFPVAHRLHEIQRSLGEQRAAFETTERERASRIAAVTAEDLDDLAGDDFSQTSSPDRNVGAALTATREPAEEDASDWIL